MTSAAVAALLGAMIGLGLFLVVRGLVGTTVPLAAVIDELHRPRHAIQSVSRREAVTVRLVGRRTPDLARDLAVCEWSPSDYVRHRLAWSGVFASPGAVAVLLSLAGVSVLVQPGIAVIALPAGLVAGWLYGRPDLRADAARARREFGH